MSDTQVALIKAEPVAVSFSDMKQMAQAIAASGLFGLKTTEQALALMLIAQAEGLHPAVAARDYDIIAGRPSKKSEAMLRSFLSAGGKVEWHTLNDVLADATFTPPSGGPLRISWDMERAKKAGIAGKNGDMYAKYPRRMLSARCISEGIRTTWPLATGGLQAPEEIDEEPRDVTPAKTGVLDRVVEKAKAAQTAVDAQLQAQTAVLASTAEPTPDAASPAIAFHNRIQSATTEAELLAVGTEIAKTAMEPGEQSALRETFRARLAQLQAPKPPVAVAAAQVPAGWVPPDVL